MLGAFAQAELKEIDLKKETLPTPGSEEARGKS